MISISREVFRKLYPKEMHKYINIFYNDFTSDEEFIEKYLPSKLWRLTNLYTIIDKDGNKIPFVMNNAQHRVYATSLIHARLIILKSRQQGISTFWLISFLDDAIFQENFSIGLMAQGKEESSTLLERVKLAWDELDSSIKEHMCLHLDKDNSISFSFSNGSTIFIRTSFRSATLQRLHVSELGKIANRYPKKAKETNTGTIQTIKGGNTLIIESTAEGDNMFKDKWDIAYNHEGPLAAKDFLAVFLSWLDDPDCVSSIPKELTKDQVKYFDKLERDLNREISNEQRWYWIMQYNELGEDIYQEYPSSQEEAFSVIRDGTYYAALYHENVKKKNRVVKNLYDSNLYVDIILDLGMNDTFVVGFFQYYRNEERLVHEYCNSGEGLEHYVDYITEWARKNKADIGDTIGPHDLKVRELGTGISRKRALYDLGVRRIRVMPKLKVNDGIEATRRLIKVLYIDESCEYIISCLKNYSKEWDDLRSNWKDKPLHDKYSHGADMIRMRAISNKKYLKKEVVKESSRDRKRNKNGVVDGMAM